MTYEMTRTDKSKEAVYLDVRIWAGRHEIKRLRIAATQGPVREQIDLGISSFLKHPVPVTFEITGPNAKNIRFSFDAEIYSL